MFVFFLIVVLFSTLIEAKAEGSIEKHSFLEIVPKDSLLYDKNTSLQKKIKLEQIRKETN